jgi:hypothetical protein
MLRMSMEEIELYHAASLPPEGQVKYFVSFVPVLLRTGSSPPPSRGTVRHAPTLIKNPRRTMPRFVQKIRFIGGLPASVLVTQAK